MPDKRKDPFKLTDKEAAIRRTKFSNTATVKRQNEIEKIRQRTRGVARVIREVRAAKLTDKEIKDGFRKR